jgi:hypothetical protein
VEKHLTRRTPPQGTPRQRRRWGGMSEPLRIDPNDQSPRERGLRRRSGETGLAPWTAAALILMLAALVYVIWSVAS